MDLQAAAKAKSILIRPSMHVDVIGNRSSFLRKICQFTYNMTLVSCLTTLGVVALGKGGGFNEIKAQRTQALPIQVTPEHVHWLKMPSSPFLQAGKVNGQIVPDLLAQRWKAARLSDQDLMRVSRLVSALTPVLMGRDDPAVELQYQQEAEEAVKALHRFFPEQEKKLALFLQDDVSLYPKVDPTISWSKVQNFTSMNQANFPSISYTIPRDIAPKDQMVFAHQALGKAMQTTGLKALRLPLLYGNDAHSIYETAKNLEKANEELAMATGFKGKVLGLNGRVELLLAAPVDVKNTHGLVTSDVSGRLQMIASWKALGHEWFHALDMVLSGEVMHASGIKLLTRNIEPLRLPKDWNTYQVWKKAVNGIEDAAPEWINHKQGQIFLSPLKDAKQDHFEHYWQDKGEMMAFAFTAHLNGLPFVSALRNENVAEYQETNTYSFVYPSEQETKQQNVVWQLLFTHLKTFNLTQSASPSIAAWKASRAKLTAEQKRPEPTWR